jgi:hypothetical protein
MYCSYFGLARKVNVPGIPASIFERLFTFTELSPTTVPLRKSAICCAENSMFFVLFVIKKVLNTKIRFFLFVLDVFFERIRIKKRTSFSVMEK